MDQAVVRRIGKTLVVAQATAPELSEHHVGLLAGRLSTVVDRDGGRVVPDLPAAQTRPAAPVDFFEVHEVALVERPDVLPGGAMDQHACAERVIDLLRQSSVWD